MKKRDRFMAALAFEKTDEFSHIEQGLLPGVFSRWQKEGLERHVCEPEFEYLGRQPDVFNHFEILHPGYILCGQYFYPALKEETIEQTQTYTIIKDKLGRTVKQINDLSSSPQHLDYLIKTKEDYHLWKDSLSHWTDKRLPENWTELAKRMREQDDCVSAVHLDGFYGFPRLLIGDEQLLIGYYTEPLWIKEMIDDRCEFYCQMCQNTIKDINPDMVFIWEDMCYRNGPLISPDLFREFMMPSYKKLIDVLKSNGVQNIIVDSDGDIKKMIPLWIEAGVTGILPFEVKAGMDVAAIAQQYPKLQIIGGIDKHALERTHKDIDMELERILPSMRKRSGYIVSLDHWVHPQIPLSNFEYYVNKVKTYKS